MREAIPTLATLVSQAGLVSVYCLLSPPVLRIVEGHSRDLTLKLKVAKCFLLVLRNSSLHTVFEC